MTCQIIGATKPLTKVRLPVTGNCLFTTWKRRENYGQTFPVFYYIQKYFQTLRNTSNNHIRL